MLVVDADFWFDRASVFPVALDQPRFLDLSLCHKSDDMGQFERDVASDIGADMTVDGIIAYIRNKKHQV